MPMEHLICPNCGKDFGAVAVNDKVKMAVVNKTCSKCHQSFAWQGEYGRIIYK